MIYYYRCWVIGKKSTYRWGIWAEFWASVYLQMNRWRILERRWRSPFGEVDLIVSRGKMVAFVEVKARKNELKGLACLTEHQWRRIEATADYFMASRKDLRHCSWRFDAVIVVPYRLPRHFPNIWHP